MIGRKTIIGLAMLCALLVSALAAQGATASGTTAHTCKKAEKGTEGAKTWKDEHCKEEASGQTGEYKHVEIPVNTKTNITGTDIDTGTHHTGAALKSTIAGSAIELVAKEVTGTGTMENKLEGAEMLAHGEGTITYTGVTEKLLGCIVTGYKNGVKGAKEIVETNTLTATTSPTATIGDKLKFQPKEAGAAFAEFELTECIVGPLRVKVFGSVLGIPNGATTNTEHNTVTADKTLRLQNGTTGPLAGIAGTLTIKAGGVPLSLTT